MSTLKGLAKRGLEYDHKINQMLVEIWDELKAMEPEMAITIESALGSAEFAALMTMGRVKGQPSFLEKLANAAPISSDDMPELWREFVSQATESPIGLRREGFTEYKFDQDELLSQSAERAKKAYGAALVDIFKELKTKDPEVAAAALDIWHDVADAAEFLTAPAAILNGQTPLVRIEDGRREDVLMLINGIKYGLPM